MRPIIRIASPVALMLACIAMAAAAQRHETRAVSGYHALSLTAPIKVELVQGDGESLTLDGDEAALAELETVVEDGSLKIRIRNSVLFSRTDMSHVVARVSAKAIDAISSSGSGDIHASSLGTRGLAVSIAGSGNILIDSLEATRLHVSIAGSGDLRVAGKADVVNTSIAGSGDMKAARLASRDSSVSIAGSGDAVLWVRDSLDVSVMGSGDVRYFGDPSVHQSVLGSGSIKRVAAAPS